jgi:hypothetical protein
VIETIAQLGLQPGRKPASPPKQAVPIWAALAAAAAVLLVVGAATYLFFAALSGEPRHRPQADRKKEAPERKPPGDKKADNPDQGSTARKTPEPEKPAKKNPKSDVVKSADKTPSKPDAPEKKPEQPEPDPISTSQSMEVFQPNSAEVAVPALFRLRDLGSPDGRQALARELARSDAFYAEVLCREATHAFPRLQAALQASGHEVIVDRTAQTYLKQPQFKANYCAYLEDVTPEEFAKLLEPLGVDDSKGDKKKPATGQFLSGDANLFVCAMTADHRKRLAALLGVDVRQTTPPTAPGTNKTADRLAVALAYTPAASKPPSPEIKRFLDARKPARKGTLQVLLVLRGRP